MKFFFIKKYYRDTENHYWLNEEPFNQHELTREKVVSEFISLAFYRLMGIPTPKTYLGATKNNSAVLISKVMKNWNPLTSTTENGQINALSSEYCDLANLELASAVIADIDVSGWNLDNLGLKHGKQLTKHDGGATVVDNDRKNYYLQFFKNSPTANQFNEGVATLTDDLSLNETYLKIFKNENISRYHLHYYNLFKNVTRDQRLQALRFLFKITGDDIQKIVGMIPDEWHSPTKKLETIKYFMERINLFRNKFGCHFTHNELYPTESVTYTKPFLKLLNQKHIEKYNWEEKYTKDEAYQNPNDFSQSSANRFLKK